jgi:hypothetical protein
MTFWDPVGAAITAETEKTIAAAMADPSVVHAPVSLEAVPDPETGQLVSKVRAPVSFELGGSDG